MRYPLSVALASVVAGAVLAASPQTTDFFPLSDVRPGMVGIGRTVYAGDTLEEFKVNIIGVLHNVIGPRRDLILAKLEGGPLATTGVMQGMSGSPVYIDGKLVGAVSYALGSFPREPIAGITPIGEMIGDVGRAGPRRTADLKLNWPATPEQVFSTIGRLMQRATGQASPLSDLRVVGPASLKDLVPTLHPIGVAMVMSGLDPIVDRSLRGAMDLPDDDQAAARNSSPASTPLRPGDPVGMSLVRGDLELGATGTVTHVDGRNVYAFGHPFLNLGPANFAMTRAQVYTVLPSLDSSMKIATLGDVIGTMSQDRATAVGGTLGTLPRELDMRITLQSAGAEDRQFRFSILRDEALTPLFAYVSLFNVLVGYERQSGPLTIETRGNISFGEDGQVAIDDVFTGDGAIAGAANAILTPVGFAATNDFRSVLPERIDVTVRVVEGQDYSTVERIYLDTANPRFGETHTLHVQLRDFRGGTETISLPVEMPAHTAGPLTLVVSDAAALAALEQRDLRPSRPTSWPALLEQFAQTRRGNRLYVRLIAANPGTVVGGETLPALPASVRSILDGDKTVATTPVAKTVVGAWERLMTKPIRGSRELTVSLSSR